MSWSVLSTSQKQDNSFRRNTGGIGRPWHILLYILIKVEQFSLGELGLYMKWFQSFAEISSLRCSLSKLFQFTVAYVPLS